MVRLVETARERQRGIDSLNHVRVALRKPVTGVALLCTGCGPDLCDVGRLARLARGLLEELVMDRGRHQELPIVWGLGAVVLLGGWHGSFHPLPQREKKESHENESAKQVDDDDVRLTNRPCRWGHGVHRARPASCRGTSAWRDGSRRRVCNAGRDVVSSCERERESDGGDSRDCTYRIEAPANHSCTQCRPSSPRSASFCSQTSA